MDATMIDVDVLIDFDQSKKIGAMTIRQDALPEFPNFVFALGFQVLGGVADFKGTVPRSEYLGPYRLMAIAPVDDVKYLDYLRQIGKVDANPTTTDPGADKAAEFLSCIEEWAERLANCKAATSMPLPAHIHVQGQSHSINLTLMEMCAVLKNNGREVPLGEGS